MKYHGNRLKGSGDMEWTRNSRLNPLTLTCDLGIESRYLGHMLCIMKIDQRVLEIWSGHEIQG